MKIVVIGAGFTGMQLARELVAEKNEVVLIERDPEKVRHASDQLDCTVLEADGLRRAARLRRSRRHMGGDLPVRRDAALLQRGVPVGCGRHIRERQRLHDYRRVGMLGRRGAARVHQPLAVRDALARRSAR